MDLYDEQSIVERLSKLDRRAKTAFAASCAQRLLPLVARHSVSLGGPQFTVRLSAIIDAAWEAASDRAPLEMPALAADAEAMVPVEGSTWTPEMGYAQNAAAAAAYAIRTWMTDHAQEAGWAARQVYELADFAALQQSPDLSPSLPGFEAQIRASMLVQWSFRTLAQALDTVEVDRPGWSALRTQAEAEGHALSDLAP